MNLFKSLFIAFAPLVLIATVYNGIMLSLHAQPLLGIGMVTAALPLLLFLSYILIFKSLARTGKHLWPVQIFAFTGLLLSFLSDKDKPLMLIVLPLISYLITLTYIYWYSNNERIHSKILAIGKKFPAFKSIDSNGNEVTNENLAQQPALFMFTRGNWCPLCMAQIDEVVAAYKELNQMGVQVVIIASQPEKNTQTLAARFDVPFLFLVDTDQKLGKQLGVIHQNGLPFGFQS